MFGRSLVKQAAAPALRSIAAKRTITTSPIALSDKLFVVNRSSSGPDSPKRTNSTLSATSSGDNKEFFTFGTDKDIGSTHSAYTVSSTQPGL